MSRLAKPFRHMPDRRGAQPEPADDLIFGRLLAVEEVVVVALEHEPAVFDADDPVQHLRRELRAVVQNDVARPIGALLADHRQVAAMQHRFHRAAEDDRVRGRPADLRRAEKEPAGGEEGEAENAGEQPGEASPLHLQRKDTAGRGMFLPRPAVSSEP